MMLDRCADEGSGAPGGFRPQPAAKAAKRTIVLEGDNATRNDGKNRISDIAVSLVLHERKNSEIERLKRKAESVAHAASRAYEYDLLVNLAAREIRAGHLEQARAHLENCILRTNETDPRGFEWYHLLQLAGARAEQVGRHQGPCDVEASPDGRLYVSWAKDGLRIWDATRGGQVHHITEPRGVANSVTFAPDSHLIAMTGDDGVVRIWSEKESWSPVATLQHDGRALGARFTPDGNRLVSLGAEEPDNNDREGGQVNALYLWDACSWTRLAKYSFGQGRVNAGDLSHDGRLLAVGFADGEVRIWSFSTNTFQHRFNHLHPTGEHDQRMNLASLAFAHHHPWLLTSSDGVLRFWDTDDGLLRSEFRLPPVGQGMWKLVFSPDDRCVAATYGDHIHLLQVVERTFDLKGPSIKDIICTYPTNGRSRGVAFADEKLLLATDFSGIVSRYVDPLKSLPRPMVFSEQPCVTFLPDGRLVIAAAGELSVQDLRGQSSPIKLTTGLSCTSVALSGDGTHLIVAGNKRDASGREVGEIIVWDTAGWQPVKRAPPVPRSPTIQFVYGDLLVCYAEPGSSPRWFDFPSLKPRKSPVESSASLLPLRLDGWLTLSPDNGLSLFDKRGLRWRRSDFKATDSSAIAVSPDGKRLAFGKPNGTIASCSLVDGNLFESPITALLGYSTEQHVVEGRLLTKSTATNDFVERLVFTPNGRALAMWTRHAKLKLWDALTGQELFEFPGEFRDVVSIALSPDCRTLAIAGDRRVLLYDTYAPVE